jgi:predicted cupin superfamily sugar epimerase
MLTSAAEWIEWLGLAPHPEGGWFRETYRATEGAGGRAHSTAIYFLLAGEQISALHRIAADEVWHFHAGTTLLVAHLEPDGRLVEQRLGPDIERGEAFQAVVPARRWFGARVVDPRSYALVGCTVAPGFDFVDLELGERAALIAQYPQHRALIERLTR